MRERLLTHRPATPARTSRHPRRRPRQRKNRRNQIQKNTKRPSDEEAAFFANKCQWSTGHQRIPRAAQSFLQTQDGCEQNVQFPSFNFLDGARIHIYQFGELFLRQSKRDTFAAHVCAERGQLRQFWTVFGHAPLGRGFCLRNTAQWGVNFT